MKFIKTICPAFAGMLIIVILATTTFAQTTSSNQAFKTDTKTEFKTDFRLLQQQRSLNLMNGKFAETGTFNPSKETPTPLPRAQKSWIRRNWWVIPVGVGIAVGIAYLIKNSDGDGGILCRDGTISNAQNRQGACSYHGGIAQ